MRIFGLEPIEPRFWPLLTLFPPALLAAEEIRNLIGRRLLGGGHENRLGQQAASS
jgi:hypothetical protein